MQASIIGREEETEILEALLISAQPELLALYGRRRVGKTYLVKNFYAQRILFSCSGQSGGTTTQQLINFETQLNSCFPKVKRGATPLTWQQAFIQLTACLDTVTIKEKKVLFFDELPWLDTHKSGFLSAFGYFWNMYAAQRNDLLIVICGSAASWIIKKIVNNKGGLHNRVTKSIRLLPFTLKETKNYLEYRNINFDPYQILQLYMVMGGIPHYLNAIQRGRSVQQNIQKICFSKDGLLANEFENLYAALFNNPEKHVRVIQSLAKKNKGLTRNELLTAGKLITGGGLTTVLDELTESGFVEKLFPFDKKLKDSLYRLADEFSLFYLRFMTGSKAVDKNQWLNAINAASYNSWCGYNFETICLKHIHQIKKALGIAGVYCQQSSWYKPGSKQNEGAQIDLLIDRSDQCINICEIKFSNKPFVIDKKYSIALRNKIAVFRQEASPKKTLLLTFITTYGLKENEYRVQLADCLVNMNALFE